MRRSSRLETATAEKRKTKMSTRLAEHAKRQRREMARADGDDEPEEGEEVDGGDDSDFIASSEEEEEEEGEDEEDEDLRPRRLNRKRRAAPSSVSTDSAESDNSAESVKKIKSILKKQSEIASEKKPKSILKRPKTHSTDSSPNGKVEPKPAADANEGHRRPVKQRSVDAIGSGSSTERKGFIGSISRTRTSIGNTLTQFFNEILEWDFHDALMRQAHKDFAVVTAANDGSEEGEVEVTRVPSKFDSYEHYFSVWKPLALEEVQAQTLNSVFTDRPVAIPLEAAAQGSNFLDRTVKIRIDAKKTGVPATQRMVRKNFDNLYVQDLVLFTPNQSYFTRAFQVHSNGGNADTKPVTESDKEGFLGILATKGGPREGVTVTVLSNDWRQYESRKSELFAFKLTSLVTSVREFRALCDCEGYRLLPLLLSGEHVAGSMQLDSLGLGYVRWLRSAFNESQLEAITAAATSEGFTLIKGPPGTGKTTTLKGLLNSIHLREYNRYYNAVLDVARRPDHETNQAWARIGNEKPHILVTAPSNAAVDNIIGKIISEGFCDGEGRKYFPKIVRVGRGMSSNVRVVGLDDMVDTVCEKSYDELQQKLISLRTEIAKVENDSMHIRNNLRHLVAAIDRDPVGFLAREAQQMQLQQQQQQQQQQHQEQVHVQKPDQPASPLSPPPVESMDSPPPPGIQLSPSASSPPPPLTIGSPPPNMAMYPSSPLAYALSTSSPPAPHSPVYGGSTVPYTFADDQDEGEEEDEAFPSSYGPPATSPASTQELAPAYNAAATSKAFNAFFDDDDDMNEEDEPLPNAVSSSQDQVKPAGDDTASDEEDEAFPPLLVDPPAPEISVKTEPELEKHSNQTESRSELVESAGSPEPAHNGNSSRRIEDDIKMDPLSVVVDDIKTEPLRVVIVHPTEPTEPMSPPPPPPMSPPPPPPMSPPPPSPPASPTVKSETVDDAVNASDEVPSPSAFQGPIIYEKYFQYRVVAQQLNACLERLSELRLEENRYYAARNGVNEKGRASSQLRQSLEVSFLDTAHIVFTTLSSAGVTALNDSAKYDVLVVDEAAQAVELSSIIPMKFGSRQCVLVGDPQQLSATVFSRTSGVSLYERSLFERLETTGHPVHMLRTQYRSHPLISDFPRHYFYDGKLQDADSVKTPVYDRPYHRLGAGAFTPLVFWNLLSSRETTRSVSRLNVGEAEMAVNLYLTLKNSCPPDAVAGKVGVITPYSQQMDELRNRFRRALGERYDTEVEINTVDGFQGREKDIILLSTVRADPKAGVGFLNDTRRMNVALTRAKFACYVIGSEITLRSSRPWAALMDHARKHECIVHVQDPNCNLLTLRPMEMPPGAQPPQGVGAQWRGGSKKGFQHPPHPHVQIPNQPPDHFSHHQPSSQFPTSGPHPGRRPSPTGAPPNYGQERGPSPTNQAWRGGRGRGGGRDARRDPRLNGRGGRGGGRGGRGSSFNGGRGGFDAGGPPGPTYQGPGPQQAYVQQHQGLPNGNFGPPPIQHEGPTNGNFGPPPGQQQGPPNGSFGPPPAQYQGPPNGNFGPPAHSSFPPRQFGGGPPYPTQGYPAPASQHMMPAQPAFQGPPAPSHFQQQQHAPPPHQYQGPPPSAGFAGPPPQQQLPPPQYHDGGQGASHAGRIRDPRLLRQQGRGGRSYGQ